MRSLYLLTATLIFLPAILVAGTDMPMMVHSDAKRDTENNQVRACKLLITANSINGEYISVVIKLIKNDQGNTLEYTVSGGHIDYTNGQETYDYVEKAWLKAGDISTMDQVTEGRGPSNYAYQAVYRDKPLALYENIVHSSFDLTLTTALHSEPYTQTFDQPFDQVVLKEAKACLHDFQRNPG